MWADSRSKALLVAALGLASCVLTPPSGRAGTAFVGARETHSRSLTAAPNERSREPGAPVAGELAVVLVTLDGTRWQELFRGVDPQLAQRHALAAAEVVNARELLPNLYALIDHEGAAIGADGFGPSMRASGPEFLSLPGYSEILSGSSATGCANNSCRGIAVPTLFDALSLTGAAGSTVAAVTSWEAIGRVIARGSSSAAVSAGRHAGAHLDAFRRDALGARLLDEASELDPAPGHDDFRPDRATASIALRYLDRERPKFFFLGLGEPDEYAHRADYRGYLAALRECDHIVGEVWARLSARARQGARTALIVTTDHGRAADFVDHGAAFPESSRVWLVAAGSAFSARGFVQARTAHRLHDVAPTLERVLGLAAPAPERVGTPLEELFASAP